MEKELIQINYISPEKEQELKEIAIKEKEEADNWSKSLCIRIGTYSVLNSHWNYDKREPLIKDLLFRELSADILFLQDISVRSYDQITNLTSGHGLCGNIFD